MKPAPPRDFLLLLGGFSAGDDECLRRESHLPADEISLCCIGRSLLYGW
jgi:hypothetical protein